MNISGKAIWQHAAGDKDRNYVDICLKWGVILFGPGYAGRYPENRNTYLNDGWTQKKITTMHRFCIDVKDGDFVVLRLGTDLVYGVGIIVADYEYSEFFGDVDGWDLQHVRRVNWLWKADSEPKKFSTYDLKFGDTTQRLSSPAIEKWLEELEINEAEVALPIIPKASDEVSIDEICDYLFDKGIPIASIRHLKEEISDLKTIASWYNRKGVNPSEFETLSYLAIPLLRALGWSPQKMAIEWNNVDVALFDNLPRQNANLTAVIEGKRKGKSCLTALSQAKSYAEIEGRNCCNKLIVTDGIRYGVFRKENGHFGENPIAYFNLTDFKKDYPIYGCKGIREALYLLAPNNNDDI